MLEIGRQGRLWVVEESTYGTVPAIASADAVRHRSVTFPFQNVNRRTILEKKFSPGTTTAQRTNQRKIAAWNLDALLRPSGTLNTLPEASEILKAAFGAVSNITLSTTVSVGTGAVGGATLAATTGLLVGQGVQITCPDGKLRVRRIVTLPGSNVVTWAPNLPSGQQPADGAAVKGLITYRLTSALAISLSLAHYLTKTDGTTAGLKRACAGAVVDRFAINFDANDECLFTASGPAARVEAAPSQPAAFTTVGGQPPSGMTAECYIGNTAIKDIKVMFEIANAMALRNGPGKEEAGSSEATEAYRVGRQEITCGVDTRVETEADIYDLAEAGTNAGLFKQQGFTSGMIIAVSCPAVEFMVPDTDDPDEEVNWPFRATALESADNALDQVFLYLS